MSSKKLSLTGNHGIQREFIMQSILSSVNKAPVNELSNDTKATKNEAKVEGKGSAEKSAKQFSDALDKAIEGKDQTKEEKKPLDESIEKSPQEAEEGALQATLVEEELVDSNSDDDLAFTEQLLTEKNTEDLDKTSEIAIVDTPKEVTEEQSLSVLVKGRAENGATNKQGEIDSVDAEETTQDSVKAGGKVPDNAVSPIIAQIEAAQKTDTQVKESKVQLTAQEVGTMATEHKKAQKEPLKSFEKSDKLTFENVLADEPNKLGKGLVGKDSLVNGEKIDSLLSGFKAETNKPILNQNVEGNVFNTLGATSSSADKLLNQVATPAQNSVLQSTVLQQPIDLHAKQASVVMGERILMMLGQGKQEVTIRLDPAELGSMLIKLQVQQDQLQVAIQTQVGQSRDIIEQNLPRLREQLAQQGINLGEASVEQQSKQGQSGSQDSQQTGTTLHNGKQDHDVGVEEQSEWLATQIPLPAQGIDYYA